MQTRKAGRKKQERSDMLTRNRLHRARNGNSNSNSDGDGDDGEGDDRKGARSKPWERRRGTMDRRKRKHETVDGDRGVDGIGPPAKKTRLRLSCQGSSRNRRRTALSKEDNGDLRPVPCAWEAVWEPIPAEIERMILYMAGLPAAASLAASSKFFFTRQRDGNPDVWRASLWYMGVSGMASRMFHLPFPSPWDMLGPDGLPEARGGRDPRTPRDFPWLAMVRRLREEPTAICCAVLARYRGDVCFSLEISEYIRRPQGPFFIAKQEPQRAGDPGDAGLVVVDLIPGKGTPREVRRWSKGVSPSLGKSSVAEMETTYRLIEWRCMRAIVRAIERCFVWSLPDIALEWVAGLQEQIEHEEEEEREATVASGSQGEGEARVSTDSGPIHRPTLGTVQMAVLEAAISVSIDGSTECCDAASAREGTADGAGSGEGSRTHLAGGPACVRSGISRERLARILALFRIVPRRLRYFGPYSDWEPKCMVVPYLLSGAPKSRDPWHSMRLGYLNVATHGDECPFRIAMNEMLLDPSDIAEGDRLYSPEISDPSLQLCTRWPQTLMYLEALGASEACGLRVAGGHEAARRRVLTEFVRSASARWDDLGPGDPSQTIRYMEYQVSKWRSLSHAGSHFFDACDVVLEGVFGIRASREKCDALYGGINPDGCETGDEHWGRMTRLFPIREASRKCIDEMYVRLARSADQAYLCGTARVEEFRYMEKMDAMIAEAIGHDDRTRYRLAAARVYHRFMTNYMGSRISDGPRTPRESRRVRGLPPYPVAVAETTEAENRRWDQHPDRYL